jgi:CRISPR-associated protein Cas1
MNPLHLSGWGVKIRIRNLRSRSELQITNGREDGRAESTHRFRPRHFPYSSIIIDGHSGYVSLQAFHWLSKNKVPVFIMNFDGTVISSILPPMPVKADLRAAQFQAASDPKKKFTIAKALVHAKIARSLQVLDWLGQRYDIQREMQVTRLESAKLGRATTVVDLRVVEGRVARRYWEAFGKVLPEYLDFQRRMTSSHQNNASDPVNSALNYGYGFLEGECRRAINAVGLEPSVGFLHDFSNYQTKQSLVYDLQEPFRWLSEISVVDAFESDALELSDFYFTGDDYRYRFESDARQRFIDVMRERFNSRVNYRGKIVKWDTVIKQTATQLGRYLTGKTSALNFAEPDTLLASANDELLRERILGLSQTDARDIGMAKSTLHNLRKNARRARVLKVYGNTRKKILANQSLRKWGA